MAHRLNLAQCLFCKYSFIRTQSHPFIYVLPLPLSLINVLFSSSYRLCSPQSRKGLSALMTMNTFIKYKILGKGIAEKY